MTTDTPSPTLPAELHADEWGCYSLGFDPHTGGHSSLIVRSRTKGGEELVFTKAEVLAALSTPSLTAMREALVKAEWMFRHYGNLHAAKPDEAKAKRNYDLADEMAAALSHSKKEDGQ